MGVRACIGASTCGGPPTHPTCPRARIVGATYPTEMFRAVNGVPAKSVETESTRDSILRTAGEVFLAHGYERTSMDEIALQSGVARRTLYNHFTSKRALFDATTVRLWEQMSRDEIIDATLTPRPPEEALYAIGRAIADFWAPPEAVAFLRLVIWESPQFPELGEGLLDNGRSPARRAVIAYVSSLNHQGFDVRDPMLAATQFIDVILGEVILGRLVNTITTPIGDSRRDYVVREAVALFLARYRRRGEPAG